MRQGNPRFYWSGGARSCGPAPGASGADAATVLPSAGTYWRAVRMFGGTVGARIGAERIDVDAAAAGEARVDRQRIAPALLDDVDEDAFDAMLVESGVTAKRYEIAQKRGAIDRRPAIGDLHRREVRLERDRTQRPEEIGLQRFLDRRVRRPPAVPASAGNAGPPRAGRPAARRRDPRSAWRGTSPARRGRRAPGRPWPPPGRARSSPGPPRSRRSGFARMRPGTA